MKQMRVMDSRCGPAVVLSILSADVRYPDVVDLPRSALPGEVRVMCAL